MAILVPQSPIAIRGVGFDGMSEPRWVLSEPPRHSSNPSDN
jgi:hypothetical protein